MSSKRNILAIRKGGEMDPELTAKLYSGDLSRILFRNLLLSSSVLVWSVVCSFGDSARSYESEVWKVGLHVSLSLVLDHATPICIFFSSWVYPGDRVFAFVDLVEFC